uniref:Uncharacterized protein n=1 Tax=Ciona intestinalis TaxID=7719 RepID=H2XUA1_CIOIN
MSPFFKIINKISMEIFFVFIRSLRVTQCK